MPRSSGAEFREIADWPAPGDRRSPEALVLLALRWIKMNQDFIMDQTRGEETFDHREVISLMMYRALSGGGLTRSLRKHIDGTDRIRSPKALFLTHVRWVASECRIKAAARREELADWSVVRELDLPTAVDPDDNAPGILRLIACLDEKCRDALSGDPGPPEAAVRHVTNCLPGLWAIFCRCAPAAVSAAVELWDADDRACVLLAIFPARLPHRAVAAYRQMTSDVSGGGITVGGTQKQISRLRKRLRDIWPPELRPPGIRDAGSLPRDDDNNREVL